MITPLKQCQEKPHIWSICYKFGSTIALRSGQLGGNADICMSTFHADTLGFVVAISPKLEMEIQFVKNRPCPT